MKVFIISTGGHMEDEPAINLGVCLTREAAEKFAVDYEAERYQKIVNLFERHRLRIEDTIGFINPDKYDIEEFEVTK